MRCTISSSSGQVLATGNLFIQDNETGDRLLCFRSERGRVVAGGAIGADGDLTAASQTLFRGFFQTWGISGITISIQS
jgi:hypothetical protein